MRIRPTVRLLVLDDQPRLLLFHVHDRRPLHEGFPNMAVYWNTPGGGVEANETYEQAAQRELWEETGINLATVGPCVWHYQRVILGDRGRVQLQERYFVVPVPTSTVSMINMLPYEHTTHRAYRWWTGQELLASSEAFQPMQLPQLVQPLFDGILPSEPIDIPG
ncbi:MAG TPA: NUDIX domain-containing protein [Anaerolineales bacterium]|nr:NUDIX domain-containing protein [Anaerolineales bacterium]